MRGLEVVKFEQLDDDGHLFKIALDNLFSLDTVRFTQGLA
jgi:hypothetical protein